MGTSKKDFGLGSFDSAEFDREVDAIRRAKYFDQDWYRERFYDVDLLGWSPAQHYVKIGALLGRPPGPDFDARFYAETYCLRHHSHNALLDFLASENRAWRPTTAASLDAAVKALDAKTQSEWGKTGLRKISYCIPIMNRLSDIQGTLLSNLEANEKHRGHVEFIIIEFGGAREVQNWIQNEPVFASALSDGYLRVIHDAETLDTWHFGKAKNAFRPYVSGAIYSSLDGDNFVSEEETRWLLDVAAENPAGFVAHHFGGSWGDGTCGRVSLPAALYRAVGYDPTLLPRQWDEIDMIIGTLLRYPFVPFLTAETGMTVFEKSQTAKQFFELEKMANRVIRKAYPNRVAPLNPRGESYSQTETLLQHMGQFNSSLSSSRRTTSPSRRAHYMKSFEKSRAHLIDELTDAKALELLFRSGPTPICASPEDVVLFTCVRDEPDLLPPFVAHHLGLGVKHVYIVDDGSRIPVAELDLGSSVTVFRTKVGDFKTSKTLWIEAVANLAVPEGGWMLTLDADEFLQLPMPFADISALTRELSARGSNWAPGLLLDMLPSDFAAASDPDACPIAVFDSYFWRQDSPDRSYLETPSVAWAFGNHAALSWCADARYSAFGTFDCLRKIPLIRRRKGWRLNQGFHTLHPVSSDLGKAPGPEVFEAGPILPIFHYKLSRLWSGAAKERMVARSGSYFDRTGKNVEAIFGAADSISRLAQLKDNIRPAKALSEGIPLNGAGWSRSLSR